MCLFCSNFHTTNAYSAATSTALYRFQRPTTNQTHLDKRWSEPGQTTYCLPTYLLNQTRTQSEEEEQEGEEEAATEEESEPARTCPVSFSPSLSLSRSLASALLCVSHCLPTGSLRLARPLAFHSLSRGELGAGAAWPPSCFPCSNLSKEERTTKLNSVREMQGRMRRQESGRQTEREI